MLPVKSVKPEPAQTRDFYFALWLPRSTDSVVIGPQPQRSPEPHFPGTPPTRFPVHALSLAHRAVGAPVQARDWPCESVLYGNYGRGTWQVGLECVYCNPRGVLLCSSAVDGLQVRYKVLCLCLLSLFF